MQAPLGLIPSWVARTVAVEFEMIYGVSHPGRARLHGFGIFGGSNGYWRTELLRQTRFRGSMMTEDIDSALRVVEAGGVLVPDPAGRLPGRGASVHLDLQCLALAEKRRAFPRALRLPGPLDVTAVREHVAGLHDQPGPSTSPERTSSMSTR